MNSMTQPGSELVVDIADHQLTLRGDGAIFLASQRSLLVADLHLGKDASFRAAGVPVPHGMNQQTLESLSKAIEETAAEHVLLLGDLIHDRDSMTEALIDAFSNWRTQHAECKVTLVRGNHDRHVASFPESWRMDVVTQAQLGNLLLLHEVTDETLAEVDAFQVGGHLHPVVSVGRGADQMRVRCFVVDQSHLTLPAFGPFKGGLKQARLPKRKFYPICDGLVWTS